MRSRYALAILATALVALSGCDIGPGGSGGTLTIVVNTPSGKMPWIGEFSVNGAQLAVDQINRDGGVKVGGRTYTLTIKALDSDLSPTRSLDNYRQAVAAKAIGIIDEGYTVGATNQVARDAGIPVLVDFDGSAALIDTDKRPNVFRVAPATESVADKIATYLSLQALPVGPAAKITLVTDDTDYGKDGATQLRAALKLKGYNIGPDVVLPESATGYSDKAVQVAAAGGQKVVVWARSPQLAQFLKDLRMAGSKAPVLAGPTGEDPLVRTQLADHAEYVDGLTFASSRPTSEVGADPFLKFQSAYRDRFGKSTIKGVLSGGAEVSQPPTWQVLPYDIVYLLKAAVEKAGSADPAGGKIVDALNQVQVKSANGDNRGFKKDNHEGVVSDDVYFAVFDKMRYKPVQDDPTSRDLPPLDQQ